jgi:hypothetical protein
MGGTGGSGGTGDPLDVVGDFNDSFIIIPCTDGGTGYDCQNLDVNNTCPNSTAPIAERGEMTDQEIPMAGTPGSVYTVTVHVQGIVEAKYYTGGTRRLGSANLSTSDAGGDGLYSGGLPDYDDYNVYGMLIDPAPPSEPSAYWFNSGGQGDQAHRSYVLDYEFDFKVYGDSTITLHSQDTNCRAIDNCGNATSNCPSPRTIATVSLPDTFLGEGLSGNNPSQPFKGQFINIDVLSVVQDP